MSVFLVIENEFDTTPCVKLILIFHGNADGLH